MAPKTKSQRNAADEIRDRADFKHYLVVLAARAQNGSASTTQLAGYRRYLERHITPAVLAEIPKKLYRQMAGRQDKILNDQDALWGIPLRGPTVDLAAVVRWLHDFLGKNGRALARAIGDDPDLVGDEADNPMLERLREEKWKLARLDRLQREQQLVAREDTHQIFGRAAERIRQAGELLQKQFGSDAAAILEEAIDDAMRLVDRAFEDAGSNGQAHKHKGDKT